MNTVEHGSARTGRNRLVHSGRTYVACDSLADDLRKLGVAPDQSILLHSSMRSLGWVEGGEAAVVAALSGVIGPGGTIVVPAMTSENSDTSREYLRRTRGMSRRTASQVPSRHACL